jgi:hypothetical protein
MSYRILAGLVVAAAAFATPARAQQGAMPMPHAPATRNVTLTGEVIDLSCRLGQGLGGADHKMCAEVCSDRGLPLAILGSDGNVYVPISTGMPGDAQNGRLKAFAEQQVRVTGRVVNQHGQRAIFIDAVTRA